MATAALCLLFLACLFVPAFACDVPVYEYALLHWARDDYPVYYLHDGTEATADAQVNALLRKVSAGEEGHANLRFAAVDARTDVTRLAPELRRVLAANPDAARPSYLLVSPKGRTLFSGRLTKRDVRDLLDSPKSAALARVLSGGAQGALLVLTDAEDPRNDAALAAAREVTEVAAAEEKRVGLLQVSRQDPKERWLVRQLLAVEADLAEIPGPMVFGVYGRCHVTEAYLGKGINTLNLTDLVRFMNGPCTCEIKAANLGVDLISNWDWDALVPGAGPPPKAMEPGGYVTLEDE